MSNVTTTIVRLSNLPIPYFRSINLNKDKICEDKSQLPLFLDEDSFKKRGEAFENEYIRRLTQEQINQLKKKIQDAKQLRVKAILEKEKKKLETKLDKLEDDAQQKNNEEK